jgi:hypothetical protein
VAADPDPLPRTCSSSTATPGWLRCRNARVTSSDLLARMQPSRPPIDVFDLARSLEIRVRFVPELGCDGAVSNDGTTAEVWLEERMTREHQRFALAHAIGHLVAGPAENADAFAGALLMPRFMLVPLVVVLDLPLEEMATVFDVPVDRVEDRLAAILDDREEP